MGVEVFDGSLQFTAGIDFSETEDQVAAEAEKLKKSFNEIAESVNEANKAMYAAAVTAANAFDTKPIEEVDEKFRGLSNTVSEFLNSTFGVEKIKELDEQLKGVATDAEGLNVILKFLTDNEQQLGKTSEAAVDLRNKIKDLQDVVNQGSTQDIAQNVSQNLETTAQAIKGAITPLGELNDQYAALDAKATQLEETLKSASTPESITQLKDELGKVYEQLDVVQAKMIKLNGSAGYGNVGNAPDKIDINTSSQDQLKAKLKELTDYATRLREALTLAPAEASVQQYNDSLAETKSQINEITGALSETEGKAQTASARLREIKEILATMEPTDLGFQDLIDEAAELQSNIQNVRNEIRLTGSNTSGITAAKAGVNGLVGAFTATSSAIALFSGSNEQLQQTMAKLFAVLTLVGGAEQFLALVNKESAVSQYLLATYRRLTAVASTEEAAAAVVAAGAETAQAVATEGAAAAQWSLNDAIAANPVGALLIAVTAVVGAIGYLIENTKSETEKAIELNKALAETQELLNELSGLQALAGSDRVQNYQNAVTLAQAQGKSEKEILDLKVKANNASREEAIKQLAFLDVDKQKLGIMEAQLENIIQQKSFIVSIPEADRTKEQKKQLELLESQEKRLKSIFDYSKGIADTLESGNAKSEELAAEQAKKAKDNAVKSATAAVEARVSIAREGSFQELRAQIAAIEAERKAQLANVNLTAGEIQKINADAARATYDLNRQILIKGLDDQENYAKATLARTKKGSFEEFNAKSALIDIQAEKEIAQANGNASKIAEITATRDRDILENTKKYNFSASEADISTNISTLNTKLSAAQKWSDDELDIKKQLIDKQEQLDIAKVQSQIEDEKLLASKILEIHSNNLVEKKKLDDKYTDHQLRVILENLDAAAAAQIASFQEIIDNPTVITLQKLFAEKSEIDVNKTTVLAKIKALQVAILNSKGDISNYIKELNKLNAELQKLNGQSKNTDSKINIEQYKEIAKVFQSVSTGLESIASSIGDTNSGLSNTISGLGKLASSLSSVYSSMGQEHSTGDKISGVIQGALQLTSMLISAAAQRAKAEKQFTQDLINQQEQYNLSLNEAIRLNAQLKGNVFLVNYQGQLRDGINALTDAQSKYQEAIKALSDGQAKVGLRNAVDWGNVLKGAGTGAVAGAAFGPIGAAIGAVVGGIVGLFSKKKKDVYTALLSEYPELLQKTDDGVIEVNKDLAKTLIQNNLVSDSTKVLIQDTLDWQDAIDKANDQIKNIISDLAGDLGGDLRNALVDAFEQGTDSAKAFAESVQKTLDNIITQMIFNNVFGSAFDALQKEMQDSFKQGGDMNWQDDLTNFFKQYSGLTSQFDDQLKAAQEAAEQAGLSILQNPNNDQNVNSLSGAIKGITEQQADLLAGQFGGLRQTGMQQLQVMNQHLMILNDIKGDTSYLVSIDSRLRLLETQGIKLRS
ncbi:hypothetical protein SAMN05428988_0161 [Chitinophaga sp. YR573]|uniref:hypothetical protein n=1 Tax=Chitinophaga sp. YR573 TaxID=1881040 RepID=UPI0008B65873|nr:hypothetical protein [Chitinophaga sp. YR573]SEV88952.1 hypothetical protein SAMN05428988_0161 [Chitinophaga sp. YR573]